MDIKLSVLLGNSTKKNFETLRKGFVDLSKQFESAAVSFSKINKNDVSDTLSRIAQTTRQMGQSIDLSTKKMGEQSNKLFDLEDKYRRVLASQTAFSENGYKAFDQFERGKITISQLEQELRKLDTAYQGYERYGKSIKAVQSAWSHYSKEVEGGSASLTQAVIETSKLEKAIAALELDLKKTNTYTSEWANSLSFAKIRQAEVAGQLRVTSSGFKNLTEEGKKSLQLNEKQIKSLRTLSEGMTAYHIQLTKAQRIMKQDLATGKAYEAAVQAIGRAVGYNGPKFELYTSHIESSHRALVRMNSILPTHEKELRNIVNSVDRVSLAEQSLQGNLKIVGNSFKVLNKEGLKPFGNISLNTAKSLGILDNSFNKVIIKSKEYASATARSVSATDRITEAMFASGMSAEKMSLAYTKMLNNANKTEKVAEDIKYLSVQYRNLLNSGTSFAEKAETIFSSMRKQGSVTRELKQELSVLNQEYKTTNAAQEKYDSNLRKLLLSFEGLENSTGTFRTRYNKLIQAFKDGNIEYDEARSKLSKLTKEYNDSAKAQKKASDEAEVLRIRYREVLNSTSLYAREAEALISRLDKTPSALKRVKEELKQLNKRYTESTSKANLFERTLSRLGRRFETYTQYYVASRIIDSFTDSLRLGFDAIVEHNQGLHDLKAILNATTAEVALMDQTIVETSKRTKFSLGETSEGMKKLGQAGFTALEIIEGFPAIANLATGTLESLDNTVKLVSTALRNFELSAGDASYVADVFGNAVNKSRLTLESLNTSFNYIGPTAMAAGLSLKDTAGAMMLLANAGVRASTQGTGFRRVLGALLAPTKKIKEAIFDAGLTLDDMNPKVVGLAQVITNLDLVVKDSGHAFELFGQRGANIVNAFLKQGTKGFLELRNQLNEVGAVSRMAEEQMQGLEVSIKNVKDRFGVLASTVSSNSGLTAGFKGLLSLTKDLLEMFTDLANTSIGTTVLELTSLSAAFTALGLVLIGIKKIGIVGFFLSIGAAAKVLVIELLAGETAVVAFRRAFYLLPASLQSAALALKGFAASLGPVGISLAIVGAALSAVAFNAYKKKQALKELILQNEQYLTVLNGLGVKLEQTEEVTTKLNKSELTRAEATASLTKQLRSMVVSLQQADTSNKSFREMSIKIKTALDNENISLEYMKDLLKEVADLRANETVKSLKMQIAAAKELADLGELGDFKGYGNLGKNMVEFGKIQSELQKTGDQYQALVSKMNLWGDETQKKNFEVLESLNSNLAMFIQKKEKLKKYDEQTLKEVLVRYNIQETEDKLLYDSLINHLQEYARKQKKISEEIERTASVAPDAAYVQFQYDKSIEIVETAEKERLKILKQSYTDNLISEKEFNKAVALLNKEMAEEKAAIAEEAVEVARSSNKVEEKELRTFTDKKLEILAELAEKEKELKTAAFDLETDKYQKEIKNLSVAESEKINILTKAASENIQIETGVQDKITELRLQTAKNTMETAESYYKRVIDSGQASKEQELQAQQIMLKARESYYSKSLSFAKNQYDREKAFAEQSYAAEKAAISTQYAEKLISIAQYEKQIAELETKFAKEKYEREVREFNKVSGEYSEDSALYQQALAEKNQAEEAFAKSKEELRVKARTAEKEDLEQAVRIAQTKMQASEEAYVSALKDANAEETYKKLMYQRMLFAQQEYADAQKKLSRASIIDTKPLYDKSIKDLQNAESAKILTIKEAMLKKRMITEEGEKKIEDVQLSFIQKRLENAQNYYNNIKDREQNSPEIVKAAKNEILKIEKELAEKRLSIQQAQQLTEEEQLENSYKRELILIEYRLASETMSVATAEKKKAQLRKEYDEKKYQYAKEYFNKIASLYDSDTKIYQEALLKKDQAELTAKNSSKAYDTALRKLNSTASNTVKTQKDVASAMGDVGNSASWLSGWVNYVDNKYSDMNRTLKEHIKLQDSLHSLSMSFNPFEQSEAKRASLILDKIVNQFEQVEDAAYKVGVRIDADNLSLAEAQKLVQELATKFNEFNSEMLAVSDSLRSSTGSVNLFQAGTEESIVSLSKLRASTGQLVSQIHALYQQKWVDSESMDKAAESVVAAYENIKNEGIKRIDALKTEWQSLVDKVKSVEEQIISVEQTTQEKLRELRRGTMTEEEKWNDKRLEYAEKIAEAEKLLQQNQFESAIASFQQAQTIAEGLATAVTNSNGETLSTLEQNTATSIELIQQASEKMKQALTQQKTSLISQQKNVRSEIGQTVGTLNQLSQQIDAVNKKAVEHRTARQWNDARWEKYWGSMNATMYGNGGVTVGPSHKNGGFNINVEGGEHIQPVRAVKHYGKEGLQFLEAFRHMVLPKNTFSKRQFGDGGSVTRKALPPVSLPSFGQGGTVGSEQVHTYQFNLNLGGRNYGPFKGEEEMIKGALNALKAAGRTA